MGRGTALAAAQNEIGQRNALASLYAAQGPGIMSGDPQALNALSRIDPFAGQEVQQNRLGMDATRQDMAFSAERMQMARDDAKRQTAAALAEQQGALDAAEVARLRQEGIAELAGVTQAWKMGPEAYAAWAAQDEDWAGVPYEQAAPVIAQTAGALDALSEIDLTMPEAPKPKDAPSGYMWNEPGNPSAGVTRLPGMAEPGPQVVVNNMPANPENPEAGPLIADNQMGAQTLIEQIDQIANDPSLDRVIGPIEGGGGNNVSDFNVGQRAYYGAGGLGAIQRIAQLQGNAWLAARKLLKGGGQITDYESRKAEAAMSRLERAQGEDEFRTALKDLRDALTEGMAKLNAADPAASGSGSPNPVPRSQSPAAPEVVLSPEHQRLLEKYGAPATSP